MLEKWKSYRIFILYQVPEQSVALLTNIIQVDVSHSVAAGVLMFMNSWTWGDKEHSHGQIYYYYYYYCYKLNCPSSIVWPTLHQMLMVNGGQVGKVLLQVGAELSMGVYLD